jgi:hypothetical protein
LKYRPPSATGDAEQEVALPALRELLQRCEVGGGDLVEQRRQGGFRENRELCRMIKRQPVIDLQRIGETLGPPFHLLRHIALQQRNRQRLAGRLRETQRLQAIAGEKEDADGEQRQGRQAALPAALFRRQPASGEGDDQAAEQG